MRAAVLTRSPATIPCPSAWSVTAASPVRTPARARRSGASTSRPMEATAASHTPNRTCGPPRSPSRKQRSARSLRTRDLAREVTGQSDAGTGVLSVAQPVEGALVALPFPQDLRAKLQKDLRTEERLQL